MKINEQPTPTATEPTTPPAESRLHPAQTVSNIKNIITLTLDLQRVHYHTWAELFAIAAKAHAVLYHNDGSDRPTNLSNVKWSLLDVIVLSWIYGTITTDLLLTVIQPRSTAREAWLRVKAIFNDNHGARASDLESKFINTRLANFPNVSDYCQRLKELADQLKDVDNAISGQRLVLQLVNVLSPAFDTVGTLIIQRQPLPNFSTARSMLTRDKARKPTDQPATLVSSSDLDSSPHNPPRNNQQSGNRNRRGKGGDQGQNRYPPWRPSPLPQEPYWHPPQWTPQPCPYPLLPDHRMGILQGRQLLHLDKRTSPTILCSTPTSQYYPSTVSLARWLRTPRDACVDAFAS
ncbi:hypothetical protein V2J09_001279 [Rumex salicifolius]